MTPNTVNQSAVSDEKLDLTIPNNISFDFSRPYVQGRFIVKLNDTVSTQEAKSLMAELDVASIKSLGITGAQVWDFSGKIPLDQVIALIQSKAGLFKYVEPDYIVTTAAIPNDPSFAQLWGLNNTGQAGGTSDADIDAPEAWNLTTGNPNLVVGVIDTGVDYTHPDLVGNIWTNPGETAGDGIDNDANGFIDDIHGWDFAYGDADPMDVQGHGTHVSGTIAASGNNGTGVSGVAWGAKIMALRFLDDAGSGSTSNAIAAINYATAMGVKITNNSWGGGGFSQALADAISAANTAGSLFIAAAGNDGSNNDTTPSYPASYNTSNIVAVASTDRNDIISSFSNYGAVGVDLAAPGSDIYSTMMGNTYGTLSGTSMATPHVSGAAALVWSLNPTWTAAQVKAALLGGTDHLASLEGKVATAGRLNVFGSLTETMISVAVSPASVSEDGATNLTYSISRVGNISAPLTVHFSISGNALPSVDYAVSGSGVTFNSATGIGSVTLAAGVSSSNLVVDPTPDSIAEIAGETVVLNITSNAAYSIATPATTGIITSNEVFPVFSNSAPITIPTSGSAAPYPSTIVVSGVNGLVDRIKVNLLDLTHTWPDDIDVMLLSPNGKKFMLMSDAGAGVDLSAVDLSFSPTAIALLPDAAAISSGTYLPTDFEAGDSFASPAPAGPYSTDLNTLINANPNGTWSLFVQDDTASDGGQIASGWSLEIEYTAQTNGTTGDNTMPGTSGRDVLAGLAGNDTYTANHVNDFIIENLNQGTDTVLSQLSSYTLPNHVEVGKILLNTTANMTGNALSNTIYAGGGNNVMNGAGGTDTVSYANATAGVSVTLANDLAQRTGGSGTDTLVNILNLVGSAHSDALIGTDAANSINGGGGGDMMFGGGGNDTYYVDNVNDVVVELSASLSASSLELKLDAVAAFAAIGQAEADLSKTAIDATQAGLASSNSSGISTSAITGGTDHVHSSLAAYTLGANVENGRILLSTAANLTGNSLNNLLYAGAGNNILNGSTGTDTVSYAFGVSNTIGVTVDLRSATVQATGGSGSDTLLGIENLIGSANADTLIGTSAANRLEGGAGNDILIGYTDADTMIGGDGSDTYYVDNAGDVVTETNAVAATGGTDHVYSSLAAYTLGANVENGRIIISTAANLTGNSLNNLLYAGAGNNTISGSTGTDTVSYLFGVSGATGVTINLNSSIAQATGGSGSDTLLSIDNLIGSNNADNLTGSTGANTISGGLGADSLTGGLGADTFVFNLVTDSGITSGTWDTITDFSSAQLDKINVAAIDANTATVVDDAFTYIGSAAFTSAGQLRYDATAKVLFGSNDDDATAEFAIALTGVTSLSVLQFDL